MGLGIGAVGGYFGNFDFTLGCGIRMGVGQVKPNFDPNIIRFFCFPKRTKKRIIMSHVVFMIPQMGGIVVSYFPFVMTLLIIIYFRLAVNFDIFISHYAIDCEFI